MHVLPLFIIICIVKICTLILPVSLIGASSEKVLLSCESHLLVQLPCWSGQTR